MKIEGQDHVTFSDDLYPVYMLNQFEHEQDEIQHNTIHEYEDKLRFLRKIWAEWTTEELCHTLKISPTLLNKLFVPVFGNKIPMLSRWAERANHSRWKHNNQQSYFYAPNI